MAGGTQACGNRHGCDGDASVEEKRKPSPPYRDCRGFPSASERGRSGAQVHGNNHGSSAGYDFPAGGLCQRPHEGEQHGPGNGPGIFQDVESPSRHFAVQGNHDQYYGWNLWRNMFSGLGILPMWNDSLLLHLPGGRELQLSSVRDDYHLRIRPEELPLRFPRIFRISFFHMYPTFFLCWLPARRTSSSARIPTEARYAFPEAGPWQTSHERRSNFPIPGPS